MDGNVRLQIRILAALILLNFLAQVPYYLHLYYFRHHQPPNIVGSLLLGAVFALFVAGYALLAMHKPLGYVLLQTFLAMEFLFYFLSMVHSMMNGFEPFHQVENHDLLLRIVYGIGYLNLFASGYLLVLLFLNRSKFIPEPLA